MAPGGLKQLKQTGSRLMPCFCLAKKFIIIKEMLLGYREKFGTEGRLKKAAPFKLSKLCS